MTFMQRNDFHLSGSVRLWMLILFTVGCINQNVMGQAANPGGLGGTGVEPKLSTHRVREAAYGIAFLAPAGTQLRKVSRGEYLIILRDIGNEYEITLKVLQSSSGKPLSIKQVMDHAIKQFKVEQFTSTLISRRETAIDGREGGVIYMEMPQAFGKSKSLIAEAYIRLFDHRLPDGRVLSDRYAFLRMKCSMKRAKPMQAMFEKLIKEVKIEDLHALAKKREKAIENGRKWRFGLKSESIHKALIRQQYFVVEEKGKAIGYIVIEQVPSTKATKKGIEVIVKSRIPAQNGYFDSIANFYTSDDRQAEFWKTVQTFRPDSTKRLPNGQPLQPVSYVESGVLTGNDSRIETVFRGPKGKKEFKFPMPRVGHIALAEAMMLHQLLPKDRPMTYGFYWYNSIAGKITFRTDQVIPTLSGYTVKSKISPNSEEIIATYDSAGRLLSKTMSKTRKMVRSSKQMIEQLMRNP